MSSITLALVLFNYLPLLMTWVICLISLGSRVFCKHILQRLYSTYCFFKHAYYLYIKDYILLHHDNLQYFATNKQTVPEHCHSNSLNAPLSF